MFNRAIKQLVWFTGMMLLGFAVASGNALACRSEHPEGSYTVRANDGVDLAYRIVGTGSQPVVLVHGWMVSGKIWDDLLPALDTSGLRLCIPDLRGTGNSDSPPGGYTLERYADDILTIAQAEHFCRFILVGHSMGGQIAQLVATKDPGRIKGLVLMASVPAAGMILPQEAVDLFRYSGGNRDMLSTILDLATIQLPPEAKERILDDAITISSTCIQESFDAWTAGGFADKLHRIVAPTLVLGTDDPFLPQDFLRSTEVETIRYARLGYLPGIGHYVENESPAETAAILQSFLAGIPVDNSDE